MGAGTGLSANHIELPTAAPCCGFFLCPFLANLDLINYDPANLDPTNLDLTNLGLANCQLPISTLPSAIQHQPSNLGLSTDVQPPATAPAVRL